MSDSIIHSTTFLSRIRNQINYKKAPYKIRNQQSNCFSFYKRKESKHPTDSYPFYYRGLENSQFRKLILLPII